MTASPAGDSTSHKARILVVDAELSVRCGLRYPLEGAGYDVVEASEGRGVIATVERERVALVITDVVMPNREGMEMIQELRRAWPTIPIIAISGRGQDYLDAARSFGACHTFGSRLSRICSCRRSPG